MTTHQNKTAYAFPWGHNRRFNAYSNWFRSQYGGRLQKVSIDAGFTCPNRDGTKGTGGCTFCSNDAFNPSYCNPSLTVSQQLETGIAFLNKRYRTPAAYLAYFQAYSNTYSELSRLMSLYEEALAFPGVAGLIIGTRPDCIDDEKLDYFKHLSKSSFIAIEYGVESCYDRTLLRINRRHTFGEAAEAIEKTAGRGIKTGAHFIFGLPGETEEEMLEEAAIISRMPLHSVKFHQLQIIRGTRIEKEYIEYPGDFVQFNFEDYISFFISFLERLKPSIVVERFSGEAPPALLSQLKWGKKRSEEIVRIMEKRLEELNTWQGRLYEGESLP